MERSANCLNNGGELACILREMIITLGRQRFTFHLFLPFLSFQFLILLLALAFFFIAYTFYLVLLMTSGNCKDT